MAYLRAHNPRPLTRTEAQCPGCGRVFSTDGNCERHKRYIGDKLICRDPAEVGLVPSERRGMTVWHRPDSSGRPERSVTGMVAEEEEVPFWETAEWRASTVASLVMRGISARRVDEIVATMVRRYREQDARDRAHEGRQ